MALRAGILLSRKKEKNDYSVGGKSRKEVKVTGSFFFFFFPLVCCSFCFWPEYFFFTQEKIQIPVFNMSAWLSLTTFAKEKLFV